MSMLEDESEDSQISQSKIVGRCASAVDENMQVTSWQECDVNSDEICAGIPSK